jgi:hypothetical protein
VIITSLWIREVALDNLVGSDLLRGNLKQWHSMVCAAWIPCPSHQDCLFSRTLHLIWTAQASMTFPDWPQPPGVHWHLSPKIHVMEMILTKEEDEVSSYSTLHFEYGKWHTDGPYSFLFSFSVIVDGTLGKPSNWLVRKYLLPVLGEFRSHNWASSRYKVKTLAIVFRKQ